MKRMGEKKNKFRRDYLISRSRLEGELGVSESGGGIVYEGRSMLGEKNWWTVASDRDIWRRILKDAGSTRLIFDGF